MFDMFDCAKMSEMIVYLYEENLFLKEQNKLQTNIINGLFAVLNEEDEKKQELMQNGLYVNCREIAAQAKARLDKVERRSFEEKLLDDEIEKLIEESGNGPLDHCEQGGC